MATPRKYLPPSKRSESAPSAPSVASSEIRLHVAGMDCADEAALVRHALARPGVLALNFDLVGRRVDVTFDPDRISAAAVLDAVGATGLTAHTHAAGDHVGDDHAYHGHHHDTAKWWAAASGVSLLVGWAIDGAYAESWTDAVFGDHGENGHAHHPAAIGAYAVSAVAGLFPM